MPPNLPRNSMCGSFQQMQQTNATVGPCRKASDKNFPLLFGSEEQVTDTRSPCGVREQSIRWCNVARPRHIVVVHLEEATCQ